MNGSKDLFSFRNNESGADFVTPPGVCPECTKDLDDDGWCFECRRLHGVNVEPLKVVDAGAAGKPRKRGLAKPFLDVIRDLFETLVGFFIGRGRPSDAQVERGGVARERLPSHAHYDTARCTVCQGGSETI